MEAKHLSPDYAKCSDSGKLSLTFSGILCRPAVLSEKLSAYELLTGRPAVADIAGDGWEDQNGDRPLSCYERYRVQNVGRKWLTVIANGKKVKVSARKRYNSDEPRVTLSPLY